MTTPIRTRWLGIRIVLNVVLLVAVLPLMVLSLFYIGVNFELGGITIGAIIALAAYWANLWPAVAMSGVFAFGYLLPTTPECVYDPSCGGSISDAWPEQAGWVAAYIVLLLAGAVAGLLRDLRAWRALMRESQRL